MTRRLPPCLKNRSSRLVKSPKCHLTDSALAAHLAGATDLAPGRDDPLRGSLFETHTVQNLTALLETHLPNADLGYFLFSPGRH